LRERELALRDREARRARLWNPLAIAILGAAVAAAGNAYVSWQNSRSTLEVETFKAEAARVFEVVKTSDPDAAARNLSFLLDTGLIQSGATVTNVRRYLKERKSGEGVSLPLLREGLSSALQSHNDCRLRVFNGLASKLQANTNKEDSANQIRVMADTASAICDVTDSVSPRGRVNQPD
jgi:hypothetical protein